MGKQQNRCESCYYSEQCSSAGVCSYYDTAYSDSFDDGLPESLEIKLKHEYYDAWIIYTYED